MKRLALPLSLTALAMLAACATEEPVRPAPAPVVITPAPVVTAPPPTVVVQPATAPAPTPAPAAMRTGFGRIESINALSPSAAAGGTTMQRLGIKMDDGTFQYVDTTPTTQGYSVGNRIELTKEGTIRRW
jgi:hypothetical protein